MKIKSGIKLKYLVLITITIILMMVISAYFEISSSRRTMFSMLSKEAYALIKTLSSSSENTLLSNNEMENLIIQKLTEIGKNFVTLDSLNLLDKNRIPRILRNYSLSTFIMISKTGRIQYSYNLIKEKEFYDSLIVYTSQIIKGKEEIAIIGSALEDFDPNNYFIAFGRAKLKGGAFIIGIDMNYFIEFRKKIGIGKLIQNISKEEDIEYIVLQDEEGIITATENIKELNSITSDSFLNEVMNKDTIVSRIYDFQGKEVLETVKPLLIDNEFYGIFRLGISMKTMNELDDKMIRRIIIISLILIGIGVVLSSLILINQHFNTLRFEFKKIQSSREKILENMADGVIAIDKDGNIVFINKTVETLFEINLEDIIGRNYKNVISHQEINNIFELMKEIKDKEITIRNKSGKYLTLIISCSFVNNENHELEFSIMVFQDITQSKILNQQLQRNEKLIAMGELAAGVSHEIRNPLNSISILIQRLKSEFEPKENPDSYHKFLSSIKVEINRLNNVIEQFLKFSKRPKLNLQKTNLISLINEIIDLIKEEARTKNIQISKSLEVDPVLDLDKEQIKQAILNIIRNVFESMDNRGELNILLRNERENIVLEIADTGCGIPKENLSKIFNIYFSTKPNGSGIGLSIVNQIISEHNGKIEVESEVGVGTKFKIFL